MNKLLIQVNIKGGMTPKQLTFIGEKLHQQVDMYLLSLPVLTPPLPRKSYELQEVQL